MNRWILGFVQWIKPSSRRAVINPPQTHTDFIRLHFLAARTAPIPVVFDMISIVPSFFSATETLVEAAIARTSRQFRINSVWLFEQPKDTKRPERRRPRILELPVSRATPII